MKTTQEKIWKAIPTALLMKLPEFRMSNIGDLRNFLKSFLSFVMLLGIVWKGESPWLIRETGEFGSEVGRIRNWFGRRIRILSNGRRRGLEKSRPLLFIKFGGEIG